jgi:translation initiation factor IF-2
MSTLDEEMATKARKIISGAVSEVVVEKRVKPRVIRRRKKIVQVEPKPVEPVDEGEEPSADGAPETVTESPDVEKASSPAPAEVEKPRKAEKIETLQYRMPKPRLMLPLTSQNPPIRTCHRRYRSRSRIDRTPRRGSPKVPEESEGKEAEVPDQKRRPRPRKGKSGCRKTPVSRKPS